MALGETTPAALRTVRGAVAVDHVRRVVDDASHALAGSKSTATTGAWPLIAAHAAPPDGP